MSLPTVYASQNGRKTPIEQMADEHLANAHAKLGKTRADPRMHEALTAEILRRRASRS